ncbi:MAG TPA: RcpC/CpaB family pilus assembly protein [Microlunatus sp.]
MSVAIVVAMISGLLLLNYVAGADQRAMAGMQTREVLVITAPVPKGTTADDLGDLVTERELPAKAVAQDAVSDLAGLSGRVANSDLQPGEQVLSTRFSDPSALQKTDVVDIPKGYSEVSVLLEPQRVVGSNLAAGDKVGVVVSIGDNAKEARTHLTLNHTLVTKVQGATATDQQSGDDQPTGTASAQPVPEGSLMITFAVSANDAEQIIYAAQYGQIWLVLENAASTTSGTRTVTEKNAQQ